MISLILPTKNRVQRLNAFLGSLKEHTSDLSAIEVILFIDDDDEETCVFELEPFTPLVIKKVIRPPGQTMGYCNSEAYKYTKGNIIMLVNDDILIRTSGWDQKIIRAAKQFPDDIYLLYPNDLFKGKKLAAFPILSRRYCELVKEPFPLIYKGAFIDSEIFEIFHRLKYLGEDRLSYLDDVVFEHMHYRLKKAPIDSTYQQRDRFGDDWRFVLRRDKRQQVAKNLFRYILSQDQVQYELPSNKFGETKPKNYFSLALVYVRQFLLDSGLPFLSRCHLFCYHLARETYARLFA